MITHKAKLGVSSLFIVINRLIGVKIVPATVFNSYNCHFPTFRKSPFQWRFNEARSKVFGCLWVAKKLRIYRDFFNYGINPERIQIYLIYCLSKLTDNR